MSCRSITANGIKLKADLLYKGYVKRFDFRLVPVAKLKFKNNNLKNIIMEKDKMYFKNKDSEICETLEGLLNEAKYDELTEITLVEAEEDDGTTDMIWCKYHGECVEKSECKKSVCSNYESKSGRGKCINKGQLYLHGESVKFDVLTSKQILTPEA